MRKTFRFYLSSTLALSLITAPLFAQGQPSAEDFFRNLTYPELEVTPRASERLEMEAKREVTGRWWVHAPIQVSAIATLFAGINAKGKPSQGDDASEDDKDVNNKVSNFAVAVGGAWILTTVALSAFYNPYIDGYSRIRKMPEKSVREQLARERLAEEFMDGPYKLSIRMEYLAVGTNLLASLAVMGTAEFNAMLVGLAASLLSFTPIIFESRWSRVGRTQEEYKKRIYGPVSTLIPYQKENNDLAMAPGLGFSFSF